MQFDQNLQTAENKLLILYIINQIEFELSNIQIAKMVINIQEINYFYLQHYISELINDNFISCRIENNNRLYKITPLGKQTLEYFRTKIRASIRKKIDDLLKENISILRTETQIISDYIPKNENEYFVTLKINEGSTCLIDLNLYAGTKEQAKLLCKSWQNNAQELYSNIVHILIKSENQ